MQVKLTTGEVIEVKVPTLADRQLCAEIRNIQKIMYQAEKVHRGSDLEAFGEVEDEYSTRIEDVLAKLVSEEDYGKIPPGDCLNIFIALRNGPESLPDAMNPNFTPPPPAPQ